MNSFLLAVKAGFDRADSLDKDTNAALVDTTDMLVAANTTLSTTLLAAIAANSTSDRAYTDAQIAALTTTIAANYLTEATSSQYLLNTAGKLGLTPNTVWGASNVVTITDAATIPVDMGTGINFTCTVSGNRTLGNPTNTKQGQCGFIYIIASGADRTISRSGSWKSTADISWPVTVPNGTITFFFYCVVNSTYIVVTSVQGLLS